MVKIKISALAYIVLATAFIMLALQFSDSYDIGILNQIAIYIILAASYNLINGVTGQFSLESNGFIAVGAHAVALVLLSSEQKLDLFSLEDPNPIVLAPYTNSSILALLVAGLSVYVLSLILASAVSRVRRDYLAIVTLGFGIIIQKLAISFPSWIDGPMGLNGIPLLPNLYWTGGVAIISAISILNLIYPKFGGATQTIRDDEDAASAMEVNTFWTKTLAFGTSAFLEGVGGGLLACLLASISPEQFGFEFTFMLLITIVLGGSGFTMGAILGAILIVGGRGWLGLLDEIQIKIDFLSIDMGSMLGLRTAVFSLIPTLVMFFARRGTFGGRELNSLFKRPSKKGLR